MLKPALAPDTQHNNHALPLQHPQVTIQAQKYLSQYVVLWYYGAISYHNSVQRYSLAAEG